MKSKTVSEDANAQVGVSKLFPASQQQQVMATVAHQGEGLNGCFFSGPRKRRKPNHRTILRLKRRIIRVERKQSGTPRRQPSPLSLSLFSLAREGIDVYAGTPELSLTVAAPLHAGFSTAWPSTTSVLPTRRHSVKH